jgi:hypothetical protein
MPAMQASLLTRFGSAAAVTVLAAGGVMATATAASAAGHPKPLDATTLSIKNKVIAHVKHHAVSSITGVLRDEHTGVNGESITLDSRTGKKPRWTLVATATTATVNGKDGVVSFNVTPTARTQYKLVFAGDTATGFRKSHSNVITLNVGKKK